MEAITEIAQAYYTNLPDKQKKAAAKFFSSIDKDKDGKISYHEYQTYLTKNSPELMTATTRPELFTQLDRDGNGTLDFGEFVTLHYLVVSKRPVFCRGCSAPLGEMYFTCSQCYASRKVESTFDVCADCYGRKSFGGHHDDALFCDNYAALGLWRGTVQEAPSKLKKATIRSLSALVFIGHAAEIALYFCNIM